MDVQHLLTVAVMLHPPSFQYVNLSAIGYRNHNHDDRKHVAQNTEPSIIIYLNVNTFR
jgi:hypothetical protein